MARGHPANDSIRMPHGDAARLDIMGQDFNGPLLLGIVDPKSQFRQTRRETRGLGEKHAIVGYLARTI